MKNILFIIIIQFCWILPVLGGEVITLEVKGKLIRTIVEQDGNGHVVRLVRECKGDKGTCFTVDFEIVDETIQNFCRTAGYDSTAQNSTLDIYEFPSPAKIRLTKSYRLASDGRVITPVEYSFLSEEEKENVVVSYSLLDFNVFK